MTNELYSKGFRLAGIGFWGSVAANVAMLVIENSGNTSDVLILINGLFGLSVIFFWLILVYGSVLVLRAKHRHWAWVFLVCFNAIGIAIILWLLEDRSDTSSIHGSSVQNT